MSAGLSLEGVVKRFGDVTIVEQMNLDIRQGEFVVLLGESGCGKSTTLRMIAGLESVTQGRILIGGVDVTQALPMQRDIAMVFQNYALYPHMNVAENMSFSLRLSRQPKSEIDAKVRKAAQILNIENLLARKPKELSGGQRQRVAIGRAIVREPKVFLFDEPLSNLDAKLRSHMRAELALLHTRLGKTTVYVTHDQVEAMTLANRIVIFDKGRVQQVGTPDEVFTAPANLFVAGFIGSPTMNLFKVRVRTDGGQSYLAGNGLDWDIPRGLRLREAQELVVGVRPQALRQTDSQPRLRARIDMVEFLGTESLLNGHVIGTEEQRVCAVLPGNCADLRGQEVHLDFPTDQMHFFDAATGDRLPG